MSAKAHQSPEKALKPRAGFVTIIGRPNAGKSTLLNRLVGQKIAIVTHRPQTTRNRVQGIVTEKRGQIVFVDTPGIHEPDSALGRQMMHEVAAALEGVDVLLLIIDATHVSPHSDALLVEKSKRFPGNTILALNKVDLIPKPKLLPLIERFQKEFDAASIVPISALKGTGTAAVVDEIFQRLPENEPFFPEDQVTDQPQRFLAAEIIREKAIKAMYHELPYAVAVFVDKFEETPRLLRIEATINVERDSQKKILIGRKGAMLKKIGSEARRELEVLLDAKIFLGLFVKVAPDWRNNPQRVRELDWHFQLEGLSNAQSGEDQPANTTEGLEAEDGEAQES